MTYEFKPHGVCSQKISFELSDGKISSVKFVGGCNGNLKGIGALVEGMDAGEVAKSFPVSAAASSSPPVPISLQKPSPRL